MRSTTFFVHCSDGKREFRHLQFHINPEISDTPLGGRGRWYAFVRFSLKNENWIPRSHWERPSGPFQQPDDDLCLCFFTPKSAIRKVFSPRSQRTGCQAKFLFKPYPSSQDWVVWVLDECEEEKIHEYRINTITNNMTSLLHHAIYYSIM